MVLADVGAVLAFAFVADAGTHDLAEAVEVVALEPETALNLLAHILRPGLGTESADLEFDHILGDAHLLHGLGKI